VAVQGIAKGDRGELAVQAMTEVGVDEVIPWAASRSVAVWRGERGDRSRERWQATAREAAKQSRRAWVPVVGPALSTAGVASLGGRLLVLHEEAASPLSTVDIGSTGDVTVVIGPEGGIAPEELGAFVTAGAQPVVLGDSVLRTSTAGPVALGILAVRLGRW
jgi:16S rRNA (uracil1498-N3)-methyltransferase